MTASDCPYCLFRSRRPNEPTCGNGYCVDQHVSMQADRAEASEADVIFARGYRCDSCGHEQEQDVACGACGSHGVIPFGFEDRPDAVEDTAALYDSVVSPGEEERLRQERQPRPGCPHCRLIGELCGLCERLGQAAPPEPSAYARSLAANTGLDPHTVSLVLEIEKVCRPYGLARTEYALASALWRAVTQNPYLRMTEDFDTRRISITDGGRRIRFEADVFPPRPVADVAEAIRQSRAPKDGGNRE